MNLTAGSQMNTVKGHCNVFKSEDAKDETSRSKAFHAQETMKELRVIVLAGL